MTWISQVSGMRRGRFRARYALAAVVVSLVAAGPAWATFPGLSGPIAFNRFEEDPSPQFRLDLFSVDPTGGGLRQLTDFAMDELTGRRSARGICCMVFRWIFNWGRLRDRPCSRYVSSRASQPK